MEKNVAVSSSFGLGKICANECAYVARAFLDCLWKIEKKKNVCVCVPVHTLLCVCVHASVWLRSIGTRHWLFTADKPECAYVVVFAVSWFACYSYSDAPSILLYVRQIVSYFKKRVDLIQKQNCFKTVFFFIIEHHYSSLKLTLCNRPMSLRHLSVQLRHGNTV